MKCRNKLCDLFNGTWLCSEEHLKACKKRKLFNRIMSDWYNCRTGEYAIPHTSDFYSLFKKRLEEVKS